jgi:hypothetical protein
MFALKKMFVLKWTISPYTSHDWVLGAFTSKRKAKAAKKKFIVFLNKRGNPFERQAYHVCDLNKDLEIYSIPGPSKSKCVMLFAESNCFGQSHCKLVYIAGCEQEAQNQIPSFKKTSIYFPDYYFTKKCTVNKYYDLPIANLADWAWETWKQFDSYTQKRNRQLNNDGDSE